MMISNEATPINDEKKFSFIIKDDVLKIELFS